MGLSVGFNSIHTSSILFILYFISLQRRFVLQTKLSGTKNKNIFILFFFLRLFADDWFAAAMSSLLTLESNQGKYI